MPDTAASRPDTLLATLLASWLLVVAVTAIGGVAGYVVASREPETYRASTTVVLLPVGEASALRRTTGGDADRRLARERREMTSRAVLDLAAERLGLRPGQLRERLTVTSPPEVDVIQVAATASSGARAAETADVVVEAYEEVQRERAAAFAERANTQLAAYRDELARRLAEVQGQLDQLIAATAPTETARAALSQNAAYTENVARRDVILRELLSIESQMEQLTVDAAVAGAEIESVEQAAAPRNPAEPKPTRTAALGALVGFFAGLALAHSRRRAVVAQDTRETAERLGVPLLGVVPNLDGTAETAAAARASYGVVLTAIHRSLADRPLRLVQVCATARGAGASTVAANLCAVAASTGQRTTLLDLDLERAGLTRYFANTDALGALDVASGSARAVEVEYDVLNGRAGFKFLPVGRARPSSAAWDNVLERLAQSNTEFAVVDMADDLGSPETLEFRQHIDGVVVVAGATGGEEALEDTISRLRLLGTPVLGLLVNDARRRRGRRSGLATGFVANLLARAPSVAQRV